MKSKPKQYDHLSEKEQLAAVKKYGSAIEYISSPSEAVQLEAVKKYGYAIHYLLRNKIWPSGQVMKAAINQDKNAIRWIKNPETVWGKR